MRLLFDILFTLFVIGSSWWIAILWGGVRLLSDEIKTVKVNNLKREKIMIKRLETLRKLAIEINARDKKEHQLKELKAKSL